MVRIEIGLPPKPKQSTTFGNGHAYKRADVKQYEDAVRLIARSRIKHVFNGEIRVAIHFYLKTPKSLKKVDKQLAEQGIIRPLRTPDIDNLAKMILDALNYGVAYNDDKQIVELHLYNSSSSITVLGRSL